MQELTTDVSGKGKGCPTVIGAKGWRSQSGRGQIRGQTARHAENKSDEQAKGGRFGASDLPVPTLLAEAGGPRKTSSILINFIPTN